MSVGPSKLRESLADMREQMPALLEYVVMTAQLTRARYNALRKEGFTEKQAIELCRSETGLL